MVKCTRSTALSDFNRLRQVRVPGCGTPETSSTRSRSRTPLIADDGGVVAVGQLAFAPRGW